MSGIDAGLDLEEYDWRRIWAEVIRATWGPNYNHALEVAGEGGAAGLVDFARSIAEVSTFVDGDFFMIPKPDGTLVSAPLYRLRRVNAAKVDNQIHAVLAAMDRGEAEEYSAKAFEGPFEGDEPPGEDVIHVLIQGERLFTFHRALVVDGWPVER